MRVILKSVLLLLVGILLSLIAGEIFLRVLSPQRLDNNLAIFAPSEDLVFAMQKNFSTVYSNTEFSVPVSTNNRGFREKEFEPKHIGIFRIVGVGDSFTFGNGVRIDETYLKQLEHILSAFWGGKIEILNCGVPAYSPWQYTQLENIMSAELKPDLFTMGFFVGNDFTESLELFDKENKPTIRVTNGGLMSTKSNDEERNWIRRVTSTIRYFLSTRSHLYVFLRNRSSQLIASVGLQRLNLLPDFCEIQYSDRMNRGWNNTQSILLHAAEFAKSRNQRLVVIILPTSYQVYPELWNRTVAGMHINPERYDLDKPQRILRDFFTQNNIEFVDALPVLRAEASSAQLFFPIDGHLTAAGHQVVAKAVFDFLVTKPLHN